LLMLNIRRLQEYVISRFFSLQMYLLLALRVAPKVVVVLAPSISTSRRKWYEFTMPLLFLLLINTRLCQLTRTIWLELLDGFLALNGRSGGGGGGGGGGKSAP
jgi:hypothetical protein